MVSVTCDVCGARQDPLPVPKHDVVWMAVWAARITLNGQGWRCRGHAAAAGESRDICPACRAKGVT
jgi:hypothetical protein